MGKMIIILRTHRYNTFVFQEDIFLKKLNGRRISPEYGVGNTSSEQEMRTLVQMKYDDYKHIIGFEIFVIPVMSHADSQFQHTLVK